MDDIYKIIKQFKHGETSESETLGFGVCLNVNGFYKVYFPRRSCFICRKPHDCKHSLQFPNSIKFNTPEACIEFIRNNLLP